MAENKLTDKSLRALKPADREQLVGDGGGLWIRILPVAKGGTINFYYRFQVNNKERRYNCGSYPDTTLADARRKRNTARELVQQGIDPVEQAAEAKASTEAALAAKRLEKTVDGLFEDWERVYLKVHHNDEGAFARAAYELDVKPTIGAMRAREVRLPHIIKVIDVLLDRKVRRKANMVLSQMRQMFRHGLGRGIVDTDPTLGISKKQAGGKEVPVERNLSEDEIKELNDKLNKSGLHPRMMAVLRLILATGARVGELTKARWDDTDLTNNTWTIPADNAKNGRLHLIHLSDYALAQISTLKESCGDVRLDGRGECFNLQDFRLVGHQGMEQDVGVGGVAGCGGCHVRLLSSGYSSLARVIRPRHPPRISTNRPSWRPAAACEGTCRRAPCARR